MPFGLTADNERFDLLEVVDRDGADEAVLHLGEERSGADETEQLLIHVAGRDQVDGADAVFERVEGGADNKPAHARADSAQRAADTVFLDKRERVAVLVDQTAAPIEHQELEHAQAAGQLAREDGQIIGVVAAHRGDDYRSGAQPLPDFGDSGIGRIGTRPQSLGRIENGRRFLGCEATKPAHQLWERARRDDHDAAGLIAAQFAQRKDERIEFGNALSGRRYQREQQALAVEFLEIKSFLMENRRAAAWFAGEVSEADSSEVAHWQRVR